MNVSFILIDLHLFEQTSSHSIYSESAELLQVPIEFDFLQVMDLYFKIHFVFSVPFEPSLVQFMGVFEKYVYGIESDTNIGPATKRKANSVFSPSVQSTVDTNQGE